MALFAIGDLHLSLGTNKPMDSFYGWDNYVARLEQNWRETVGNGD
ncbi:MAG TPA: serine/threonine protein phosphatase, partial [Oscillospiraceae bacterium]|nr:serine/threonine protein phosphatase [Oscillospiraceae bacterium]